MERVKVTIYTDPGCPFGFNAQRQEAQLLWHYGEGLDITRRMIVLHEKSATFEDIGPPDRLAATIDACRAYVGARIDDPARADPLLRSLRRHAFSDGQPLDALDTIHGAAHDAHIDPATVDAWLSDGRVEQTVREDMAATRSPMAP